MDGILPISPRRAKARPLVIGLVNNMGSNGMGAALEQFSAGLTESGHPFSLRHLTLKNREDAPENCTPIDGFPDAEIDALIVTGMEPRAADLRDEWIFPRLAALHDWCELHTVPVIWSCLSAHAAVLHSDDIRRQRMDTKLSGVFSCTRAAAYHPLLKSMPKHWECPHSRYNGLPEDALVDNGYFVLSRAGRAGVDIFTRRDGTPFFYFQGHPEYKPDTLLREYIRDARRFAAGESAIRPAVPSCYLDADSEQSLAALCAGNETDTGGQAGIIKGAIRANWQKTRRQLFSNWMSIVADHARAGAKRMDNASHEEAINLLGVTSS